MKTTNTTTETATMKERVTHEGMAAMAPSLGGNPLDEHFPLGLHGLRDLVHREEGGLICHLGEDAIAAVGFVQVRVGLEVDEELRVAIVRDVPVRDGTGAARV